LPQDVSHSNNVAVKTLPTDNQKAKKLDAACRLKRLDFFARWATEQRVSEILIICPRKTSTQVVQYLARQRWGALLRPAGECLCESLSVTLAFIDESGRGTHIGILFIAVATEPFSYDPPKSVLGGQLSKVELIYQSRHTSADLQNKPLQSNCPTNHRILRTNFQSPAYLTVKSKAWRAG
jgi:hypothetical protein